MLVPEVIRRENQLFKVFLIVSWLFPGLQRTLNVPWDPRSVRRGDRGWCSVTDPGSWNLWGWKSSLRAPGPAVPQHCRVPECHNKLRWPCGPLLAGHTLPGITAPVTSSELLEQSWFPFSKHSCLKHQSHRVSPLLSFASWIIQAPRGWAPLLEAQEVPLCCLVGTNPSEAPSLP